MPDFDPVLIAAAAYFAETLTERINSLLPWDGKIASLIRFLVAALVAVAVVAGIPGLGLTAANALLFFAAMGLWYEGKRFARRGETEVAA